MLEWCSVPGPYQHGAVVVNGELLDLGELILQVLQERVVEGKLTLQGAIRDTAQALQHRDGLCQDVLNSQPPLRVSGCLRALSDCGPSYQKT